LTAVLVRQQSRRTLAGASMRSSKVRRSVVGLKMPILLLGLIVIPLLARPLSAQRLSPESAKTAVMAALPALIDSIWGGEADPLTVRLGRYVHVRLIFSAAALEPKTHEPDWINSQLATSLVLEVCDFPRLVDCVIGDATMVVGISEPSVEGDGRVRILVSMGRRDTEPSSSGEAFAAEFAVWLRPELGNWVYDGYQVLEIT
jgi:hypothetical protein